MLVKAPAGVAPASARRFWGHSDWEHLFWLCSLLLLADLTGIDLLVADWCYLSKSGHWLLGANTGWKRWVFYTGPKVLIALLGSLLLFAALSPDRILSRLFGTGVHVRRSLAAAVTVLVLGPLLVSSLKVVTQQHCPFELQRYGGQAPYEHLLALEPLPPPGQPKGRCFPAAHASGGFALLGLVPLARQRRAKRAAYLLALACGSLMGLYQMLRGAHFLSHTLATLILMSWTSQRAGWLWHLPSQVTGGSLKANHPVSG